MLSKIMKPKSIAVIGASTKPKTIGSELMQKFDRGTLTADKFMKILTSQRNPDMSGFMSNNTKGLSTDSFKLIGDFGGKKNNNLR